MKQKSTTSPYSTIPLRGPRQETLDYLRALARFVTPQSTEEDVARFRQSFHVA